MVVSVGIDDCVVFISMLVMNMISISSLILLVVCLIVYMFIVVSV